MGRYAPEIVVIGGGTGPSTLLQELKEFTPNLIAVVNMSDDGGSTGILRAEKGVLPPGDIRQCLVALSNNPEASELFARRVGKHPVGNRMLANLQQYYDGDFEKAVGAASEFLDITGAVLPSSLIDHHAVLKDGNSTVYSESLIVRRRIDDPNASITVTPDAPINPKASEAIKNADIVVVAPGNPFGSIYPTLAVKGMREAFNASRAKKALVANLYNIPGQTDGWHAARHAQKVEEYVGQGQIDYLLYNNTRINGAYERYARDGEKQVETDEERFRYFGGVAIGANLVSKDIYVPPPNDLLAHRRTAIRHDAYKVSRQLMRLFYER